MQHNGAGWTRTRELLVSMRRFASKLDHSTRQSIASQGCAGPHRGCRAGQQKANYEQAEGIPVVVGRRLIVPNVLHTPAAEFRERTLIAVKAQLTPLNAVLTR